MVIILAGALALLLLAVLGIAGIGYKIVDNAAHSVQRVPDALPTGPGVDRPSRATSGPGAKALNLLLIGSDARFEDAGTAPVARGADGRWGRSDTMMLVHLADDRRKAYVISIPRDSWVPIPGRGQDKINAAYAIGGPKLLVQTVERLTDVRIDHLAIIDFSGLRQLTDALGGVTITTESGPKELDGVAALDFVRQRKTLPRGDFDRVQRQQAFLRAVMKKTLSAGTLTNPSELAKVLRSLADTTSVDEGLDNSAMRKLALSLRHLRGNDVSFLTAPVAGTGSKRSLSVVYLDEEAGQGLWKAVREDRVGPWLAQSSTDTLGSTVADQVNS